MKTTTSQKLFPRKILTEVLPYLDKPGIILLVGARQTGKTSINVPHDGSPERERHR